MNKYQKALDEIRQSNILNLKHELYIEIKNHQDLLQELVDRATPYKPKNIIWNEYEVAKQGQCKCGRHPVDDYDICGYCGQALDWEQD